jgi:predicted dienelactone hydrolase
VAFAVGWNSWVERYDLTMRHLASHGFVVIAPTVADRRARPLFSFDPALEALARVSGVARARVAQTEQRAFLRED